MRIFYKGWDVEVLRDANGESHIIIHELPADGTFKIDENVNGVLEQLIRDSA